MSWCTLCVFTLFPHYNYYNYYCFRCFIIIIITIVVVVVTCMQIMYSALFYTVKHIHFEKLRVLLIVNMLLGNIKLDRQSVGLLSASVWR